MFESEFGEIPVTYRPYQMTPAREAEIARMSAEHAESETDQDVHDTEQGLMKIVTQFCEVVEAIGIVGPLHEGYDPRTGSPQGREIVSEGEAVPIVPDVVRHFSSAFMVSVLIAIARDSRPKSKR